MRTDTDSLTKTDLLTVIYGREAIRKEIMLFFRRLKMMVGLPGGYFGGVHLEQGGKSGAKVDCEKAFSDWRTMAHNMFFSLPSDQDYPLQLYDPLNTLQELHLDLAAEGLRKDRRRSNNSFCTACRIHVCQIIQDERELIWGNLSEYFDSDTI